MNGQTKHKLIGVGVVILVIFFIALMVRVIVILPDIGYDEMCSFEYGENWRYEKTVNFGRTCIELDYISLEIINRTELGMTLTEASDKYCDIPGFWELSKWTYECKE